VRDHWKSGDAILTGTPAAAAIYLGRNDYYAVEGSGGYAYRIMQRDGQQVDRWLGSPWLETDEQLRAAGLSGQKTRYMRDLSRRVLDGSLVLGEIESLDDEAVIDTLTSVKGIGRWTAEMFLIFRMQRPDVLPVGDLGIVKAVQQNYGMRKVPDPKRLTRLGEQWRPYRSVACWYLWASLNNTPDQG